METEIIRPEHAGLLPSEIVLANMSPEQIEERCLVIDKIAEARQRMIQTCLKRASNGDFIDFDGKPYLEGEGAMRIASTVGIHVERPEVTVEWVGDDCFVEAFGEASWPVTGARASAIGDCNTRDKFFSGKDGESATMAKMLESANGDRHIAARMLLGKIKKKAVENWTSRVVCAVMGIKGLTWDDLAGLGFARERAGAGVQYAKGSATAGKTTGRGKAQAAPFVQFADIKAQAVGAVVSTAAFCVSGSGRSVNVKGDQKPIFDVMIRDPKNAAVSPIKASLWGNQPEWWSVGCLVDIQKLQVKEYNGQPQYTIQEWSPPQQVEAPPEESEVPSGN